MIKKHSHTLASNGIKSVFIFHTHSGGIEKRKSFGKSTQKRPVPLFPPLKSSRKHEKNLKKKNKIKETPAKASKLNFPWAKLNFPRKLNFLISLLFASLFNTHYIHIHIYERVGRGKTKVKTEKRKEKPAAAAEEEEDEGEGAASKLLI